MFLSAIRYNVCFIKVFSLTLCISLFTGCVKEDREECPCRLIVDMSEVDPLRIEAVKIAVRGNGGYVFEGMRSSESYMDDEVILVPREDVFLNVSYADCGMMTASGLNIPEGCDCPPVYMYSVLVPAAGREFVRKPVTMMKNHCVMTIYLEDDKSDLPFDIVIRGNVCGYDSVGYPMEGKFRCEPVMVSDESYAVVLPRQIDSSLLLEVNDGSETLKVFALGEYVKACGYDWSERDLKDIVVRIDYARTRVQIAVKGWSEVYEFDIVI